MEGAREIAASDVIRQAEAASSRLVNALELLNSSMPVDEFPQPRVQPSAFRQTFAALYVEFVGRWSVIRP